MKKNLTLLLLLVSVSSMGQESDAVLDSLNNALDQAKNDSLKADTYAKIGWRQLVLGRDISLVKSNLDSAKTLYQKKKDTIGLVNLYYRYGVMHRFQGNFIKASEYFDKILPHYESYKDSSKIANTLFQKGVISEMIGDYEKSLSDFLKILKIYEAQNNQRGIGLTLNSLGVVYTKLIKYSEAIESFKKSIAIHESRKESVDVANGNSNLADVYLLENNLDKAEEHYHIARKINLETQNQWGRSLNNQKLSEVLILNENYADALPYLKEALEIQKKNTYTSEMAFTLGMLGKVYRKLGDFNSSERYLKKGLNRLTSAKEPIAELHQQMYLLFEENKKYELANIHLLLYQKYKDSILNEESLNNTNLLQIRFETEKKDKEITQQKLRLETKENELQKKKTQYSIMTGITIILLISSLMGWFLYQQRQKRKNQEILTLKREQQVKTLESLMEGEEKERFRIAKELHDGVNGDLSAIKYKLTSMLEYNTAIVNDVVAMIDRSSEQVRAISHNLVPPSLEKFNLVEALEDYCTTMNEVHPAAVTYQHLGEQIAISKNNEINIYRIVQELVSNSLKHSGAKSITVQTSNRENIIQMTVEDNGKGFDPDTLDNVGIGLKNIDSRVRYLNAVKDVVSNSKGTSYTIEIDTTMLNDN